MYMIANVNLNLWAVHAASEAVETFSENDSELDSIVDEICGRYTSTIADALAGESDYEDSPLSLFVHDVTEAARDIIIVAPIS